METEKDKFLNKFKEKVLSLEIRGNKPQKTIKIKTFGLILSYLGMIFRIIMQIGELYVCIIILNIMFEYLIIYLCSTVSKNLYIFIMYFLLLLDIFPYIQYQWFFGNFLNLIGLHQFFLFKQLLIT